MRVQVLEKLRQEQSGFEAQSRNVGEAMRSLSLEQDKLIISSKEAQHAKEQVKQVRRGRGGWPLRRAPSWVGGRAPSAVSLVRTWLLSLQGRQAHGQRRVRVRCCTHVLAIEGVIYLSFTAMCRATAVAGAGRV